MSEPLLTLSCLVINDVGEPVGNVFLVRIAPAAFVDDLVKEIRKEAALDVPGRYLMVWKPTPFPSTGTRRILQKGVKALGLDCDSPQSSSSVLLDPASTVDEYFQGEQPKKHIHVLVQLPAAPLKYDTRNKRPLDLALDSAAIAPPEAAKRRRLKLLPPSKTIFRTVGDEDKPDAPMLLPTWGAGFNHLTTYANMIGVDKTKYIEELDKEPTYQYLFLRPRRFGKSTFLQTLAKYYDKTKQSEFGQIFGGLYIGKNPTAAASSLLVLCFDFSGISVLNSFEKTEQQFHAHVNLILRRFLKYNLAHLEPLEIEYIDNANGGASLENVLELVQSRGRHLFVGVDEYDAPANSALFSTDHGLYELVADFFKTQFFSIIKRAASDGPIVKYWLTGVLPAFCDGISPLTAAHILSDNPKYHGVCGLTEAEVDTITEAYLSTQPHAVPEAKRELKLWYNGYRFLPGKLGEVLYNPQLVFTHLRQLATDPESDRDPRDEIEAIHTSSVLKAIPNDAELPFDEMFLHLIGGGFTSDIRRQFNSNDLHQPNKNPWITPTLLYYFGVITYAPTTRPFLVVPNSTMRQMIQNHMYDYLKATYSGDNSLAALVDEAYDGLINNDEKPIVSLLEKFFRPRPARAVKYSNEDTLRTILETFWSERTKYCCIAELRLLMNPQADFPSGRFGFVDLVIPDKRACPFLELKNVTLESLWRGAHGGAESTSMRQLDQLRDALLSETEAQLLNRKYVYNKESEEDGQTEVKRKVKVEGRIRDLKNEAFEQARRYLNVMMGNYQWRTSWGG